MKILDRLPGERFSRVVAAWEGETAVLIGTGPSLTFEQVESIGRARDAGQVKVIAVNDAYLMAPWADVHFASDSHWHAWHTAGLPMPALGLSVDQVRGLWRAFAGEKCTIQGAGNNVEDDAVHMLRNRHHPDRGNGLSTDPLYLVTGWHSGFTALNLATLAGSKLIILVGYDGQPNASGLSHFFGEHPRPTPVIAYEYYRRAFCAAENRLLSLGVRVINCSPGSAIDSFEKMSLEEALMEIKVYHVEPRVLQ